MHLLHVLVGAAAAAVVVFLLRELKHVLLPFAFAAFLFYLADPVVKKLAAWGLPRKLGIALVLLAGAGALAGALAVIGGAGSTLSENAPRYKQRLESMLGEKRVARARGLASGQQGRAETALAGVGSAAGGTILVFAYLTFLLLEAPRSRERWTRSFPRQADTILEIAAELERSMVRFVWLQTCVSLGTALVFWGVLAAHGVKLAAFWSLLNFISQYVPNIGPIVSSVPPVLMGLLDSEPRTALSLALFLLGSQFLIGNFLEPKIIGHGTHLDPISVLLGIVFFGWLWGVAGSFLAVPILIAVKVVCGGIPALRPIAGLLQGAERSKKGA